MKREFTKQNVLVIHRRNREDIESVSKVFLCDLLKNVEYRVVGQKLHTEKIDKIVYNFWQSGFKHVSNVYKFNSPEENRIYSLQTYMEHMNLHPLKDIMFATSFDGEKIMPWAAGKGDGSAYPETKERFWHGNLELGSKEKATQKDVDDALQMAVCEDSPHYGSTEGGSNKK